jgi:hypothetical protein
MRMSLDDGTIHARGETKIVGVNDQTAHRVSLAGEAADAESALIAHWAKSGSPLKERRFIAALPLPRPTPWAEAVTGWS